MKVTRVGIGRLHNLGNYEHIRYDVTVEFVDGEDVGPTIARLERLLGALAPVKKDYDYERAVRIMADPEKQSETSLGLIEQYKKCIEKHDAAIARRRSALEAFDNLGGVSAYTDAKEKWEDDDYDY